jgi:putative nucleotidyltransferase with HDIG domain/PAS domain S-box-containing protein
MTPARPELQPVIHLLDALNCGALLIDRAGTIVHSNARICRMMHLACGQLIGRNIVELYDVAEDRAHVREILERFEEDREEEFFLPLPDGERLPIISSSRPLPGEPPLSDHRVVTIIDIAKQKQAESQMRDQYNIIVEMSDTVLEQALELKNYSQKLEERVRQRTRELHDAHMEAIYMLAVAAEAKDMDTGRHVRRIEHYSQALAERLGLPRPDAEAVGYSAILHDIGKIHVPDRILAKPGPLDDEERRAMQQHTLAGERILADSSFFDRARRIARSHHENWDGSGYPDQLSGESIPIEARIVHVADVYDALTTRRVYKEPWPAAIAAEAVRGERGRMFDPALVDAFDDLIRTNALRIMDQN